MNFLQSFFLSGNERTLKAKKNILFSLIIKGVSIVTSLVLVPLTLGYVNSTQYGIWLTISSILSWFSFFDMGFAHGFRNRCAEALAKSDIKLAKSYVSTTYFAFIAIFSLVFCAFFIVNRYLDWSFILGIPAEIGDDVRLIFDVVSFFFCFQIVLGVLNSLLLADQRPALSSFIATLGQVIILAVIYCLTKITEGSLITLSMVMSIVPVIVLLISSLILFNKKYKDISPNIRYFSKRFVKDIVGLGAKFFIIQIALLFTFQSLNIIISHTQGPEQVTVYNVTYKCFSVFNMLFAIIMTPFWSAFTDAYTKGDYAWMKSVYKKLQWVALLFVVMTFVFLLCSSFIYKIWLHDSVSIPFSVSLGMAIYISLTTIGSVPVTLLNGIGKIKIQMFIQIFMALITIPCLLYILNRYSLFWGLLFASINPIAHLILCNIQLSKLLNKQATSIWNE